MTGANVVQFPGTEDAVEGVLLTPGTYTGLYVGHRGIDIFRSKKLRVDFQVVEHFGVVLSRWYRVTSHRGRISAPRHSDLVREVSDVLERKVRGDRVPVASMADIIVKLVVKTVTFDQAQRELSTVNQYSVIARVEGRA